MQPPIEQDVVRRALRRAGCRFALALALACLAPIAAGCKGEEPKRERHIALVHKPGLLPKPLPRSETRVAPPGPHRSARADSTQPAPSPQPAASSQPAPRGQTEFTPVSGAGYAGYVRSAENPLNWTPTAADIAAMEAKVPTAFQTAVARGDIPAAEPIDLATYTRQYAGFTQHDRRIIEVMFVCERSKQLARQPIHVSGGYTCFIHTAYEPDTGAFRYWRVNASR
jgi:hypothetical protein